MTQSQPQSQEQGQLITLSSGVVLRRGQPAVWAITEVERQMAPERPKPPMLENPDRGRAEPNEADPDYQDALADWGTRVMERRYQVIIATSTRIERIPEGVPDPYDPQWVEMLAALGIACPADMTESERYLRWVKFVAAPANEDWLALYAGVPRQIGVPEEDVAAAQETFRRDA